MSEVNSPVPLDTVVRTFLLPSNLNLVFRPTSTLLDLTLKPGQFLGVRSDLGLPMMASNPVDADYSTFGTRLARGRVAVEVYGFKPDFVKGI